MIPRSGNHLVDQKDDEKDLDLYHCPCCDKYVPEDEWNNKRNMCYSCWWEI